MASAFCGRVDAFVVCLWALEAPLLIAAYDAITVGMFDCDLDTANDIAILPFNDVRLLFLAFWIAAPGEHESTIFAHILVCRVEAEVESLTDLGNVLCADFLLAALFRTFFLITVFQEFLQAR